MAVSSRDLEKAMDLLSFDGLPAAHHTNQRGNSPPPLRARLSRGRSPSDNTPRTQTKSVPEETAAAATRLSTAAASLVPDDIDDCSLLPDDSFKRPSTARGRIQSSNGTVKHGSPATATVTVDPAATPSSLTGDGYVPSFSFASRRMARGGNGSFLSDDATANRRRCSLADVSASRLEDSFEYNFLQSAGRLDSGRPRTSAPQPVDPLASRSPSPSPSSHDADDHPRALQLTARRDHGNSLVQEEPSSSRLPALNTAPTSKEEAVSQQTDQEPFLQGSMKKNTPMVQQTLAVEQECVKRSNASLEAILPLPASPAAIRTTAENSLSAAGLAFVQPSGGHKAGQEREKELLDTITQLQSEQHKLLQGQRHDRDEAVEQEAQAWRRRMNDLRNTHRQEMETREAEQRAAVQHERQRCEKELQESVALLSRDISLKTLVEEVHGSTARMFELQQTVEQQQMSHLQERETMLASREQQVTVAREQLQAARLELDTDRRKLQETMIRWETDMQEQRQLAQEAVCTQTQEVLRIKIQREALDAERVSTSKLAHEERTALEAARAALQEERRLASEDCQRQRAAIAEERSEFLLQQKTSELDSRKQAQRALWLKAEAEAAMALVQSETSQLEGRAADIRRKQHELLQLRRQLRDEQHALEAERDIINSTTDKLEAKLLQVDVVRQQNKSEEQRLEYEHAQLGAEAGRLEQEKAALHCQKQELDTREQLIFEQRVELSRQQVALADKTAHEALGCSRCDETLAQLQNLRERFKELAKQQQGATLPQYEVKSVSGAQRILSASRNRMLLLDAELQAELKDITMRQSNLHELHRRI